MCNRSTNHRWWFACIYSYGGLCVEYDAVAVNLIGRKEIVSLQEAQFLLQSHEARIEQQHIATSIHVQEAFANFVASRRGNFLRNHNRGGRGYEYY